MEGFGGERFLSFFLSFGIGTNCGFSFFLFLSIGWWSIGTGLRGGSWSWRGRFGGWRERGRGRGSE